MDFIQIKNKNQYQREQLIQFFEKLQTMKPFVKIFTNDSFESFTIFPVVKTRKEFRIANETYSTENLTKTFDSNKILDKSQRANNNKKTQIKQFIQASFQQALQHNLINFIQDYCHIQFQNRKKKAKSVQIQKLSPLLFYLLDKLTKYIFTNRSFNGLD